MKKFVIFDKNFKNQINSAEKLFEKVKRIKIDDQQEHLILFYLDSRKVLLGYEIVHVGGICEAVICLKTILRKVITKKSCIAFILAHNHPSGNATPSKEDIETTSKISKASDLIEVELLDHVIFTKDKYYSMRENGFMNNE